MNGTVPAPRSSQSKKAKWHTGVWKSATKHKQSCIHIYAVTFIKTIKILSLCHLPVPLPSHYYWDDCLIGITGEAGLKERFQGKGSGLMNQFGVGTPCIRDSVEDVI